MVIGNKQIQTIENKQISTIENGEYSIFIKYIEVFFSHHVENHSFWIRNISRVCFKNEFVHIWQNRKGEICYSFNLLDKEYFNTTSAKLGNVLSKHFEHNIEVLNNRSELLKKYSMVTAAVIKSYNESEKYMQYNTDSYNNQEKLYQNMIELSTTQYDYNQQGEFIFLNELPLIYKEVFQPNMKSIFYRLSDGLIYKNKYIPSKYMVIPKLSIDIDKSIILSFIFYMVKKDVEAAKHIFTWLSYCFNSLSKSNNILVLHSQNNTYMELFYEEIICPLFNGDYCEKIDDTKIDKNFLSTKLDEKIIYNFYNISSPMVLDTISKEFTKKLLYKDFDKLNNKNITTVANILVTSTSNYLPLVGEDIPNILVDVESNLDDFCKMNNINIDPYTVASLIKNDLKNFAGILRSMDFQKMNFYKLNYKDKCKKLNIMDGDTDLLVVFNNSIKNKDLTFFKKLKEKLYKTLESDFNSNRIDRGNLIEYFIGVFGEKIYTKKNYRKLISDLKSFSKTEYLFDSKRQFQIHGRVYFSLQSNAN